MVPKNRPQTQFPLILWVVVAVTIALSASALYWRGEGSGQQSSTSGQWMTAGETVSEYRQEAKSLHLAPGFHWPKNVYFATKGPDGAPMRYEQGSGIGQADLYWFNTWASVAVSTHSSPIARRSAIKELPQLYDTPLFTEDLLVDQEPFREMISAASQGDLSLLRAYAKVNQP